MGNDSSATKQPVSDGESAAWACHCGTPFENFRGEFHSPESYVCSSCGFHTIQTIRPFMAITADEFNEALGIAERLSATPAQSNNQLIPDEK